MVGGIVKRSLAMAVFLCAGPSPRPSVLTMPPEEGDFAVALSGCRIRAAMLDRWQRRHHNTDSTHAGPAGLLGCDRVAHDAVIGGPSVSSDPIRGRTALSSVGWSRWGICALLFIAKLAGYILEWTGQYRSLFIIAASAYLVDLLVIHLLNPRLKPMEIGLP
ncbi:MAG: hypothetical protein A2Y76_08670 [Planctomycetes bacterium RBG_13_60_9]|nr:MAG: hypothetical protein A2Y76_08670 [Planctomycetes bacterium RBG_13_60_9]